MLLRLARFFSSMLSQFLKKLVALQLRRGRISVEGDEFMKMGSFLATMGAGIAVGALGAMMLPKNGEVYKLTKGAANTIKREAENVIDSMSEIR